MVVNLVKRHPVEDLVSKLKSGKTIAKEQVIRESMLFRLAIFINLLTNCNFQ